MNIPRYWVRAAVDEAGEPTDISTGFVAFGWSDESQEQARAMAMDKARKKAEAIGAGRWPMHEYPYPDRPVREPILEADAEQGWALTRNAYGAVVLNCERVMFVDIDIPEPRAGLMRRMFGRKQAEPPDATADARRRVRKVVDEMSGMGMRLYRTAAGVRGIITTETFDPTSDLSRDILNAFGSDPYYVRLCRSQASFRARLTPKPWRCGRLRPPREQYPFRDDHEAVAFERWLADYEKTTRDFGVCQWLETVGTNRIDAAVQPIITLHDQWACRGNGPLA